ncbi:hypothetical protein EI94DRAFT_1822967 [Lactarius quietus]|nr:hypothetical protein EI94DRAFT_1822967 [Lactarius quietus]
MPTDDSGDQEDEDEMDISGDPQAYPSLLLDLLEYGYPSWLDALVVHVKQPKFLLLFSQFLYKCCHPDVQTAPFTLEECPAFDGTIKIHHSAITTFYAPSNLSGSGGLQCE